MIKRVLFFVFIISFQLSLGQEVEFGKVTKEELLEEVCAIDKSANAAILYKQQKTYFNSVNGANELITEIHKRVKIYNSDGFDYATEVINLFKAGSSVEVARKIKAYTFNIENGKVKKTDLEKNQIFKSKLSYNYNQIKLTMPNVKEGSVIDIKYQIRSPFIWSIDEFVFQYDIPIKKLEAEIRTPKGFRFNTTNKGHITFFPKRSTKTDNRLGMQVIINKYFLNNVPALKEESYVDNIDNYRAGVMFELVSVEFPGYFKSYSQTWRDVAKTIGSSDDYKNKLDKTNSFDDELDDLISGKTDQVEKMKIIFKYIKDNLKWNGMDGKYFFHGIRKALKEKKGNAADINLTLVAMLRYAGIDSNPVILSTKDNVIPFFPTVDRLNYVIAYAVINEKKYFLDATEEFSDINLLPVKDYNWKGIYIDNNKLTWKQIDINSPEQAVAQYSINAELNEDGEINGKLSARYTKHNALEFRKEYKNQDEESFIASKEESLDNIEISNYLAKNTDSYEGFVSETFDYYQENGADLVDNKIYFQPLSFLSLEENPFKLEERNFPVDFGYPFAKKYMVNITLPEGYTVESTPNPVKLKIPNNLGELKYIPRVTEKNIQLIFTFDIKKPRIMTDNYLFLKQFFNQMIIKCKEQIVLTKV